MQNRMIFRVLMIIGIIANLGVIVLCAAGQSQSTHVDAWEKYSSKDGGYSIAYPQGWTMVEKGNQETNCRVKFTGRSGAAITIMTPSKSGSLAELAKPGFNLGKPTAAKDEHETMRKIVLPLLGMHLSSAEAKPLAIAGRESYATDFEFVKYNGLSSRKMKGMFITAWNGDSPINFLFACPEGDYAVLIEAFKKMLLSFQPAEQTPQENPMEQFQQMIPQQ